MPSLGEGFPFTMLEAMAAGVPVIASHIGGINECIEHQISGLLVPPGDGEKFTEAVLYLLRHPKIAQQLGQRGKERVERLFELEGMIEKTKELYVND